MLLKRACSEGIGVFKMHVTVLQNPRMHHIAYGVWLLLPCVFAGTEWS